MSGHGHVGQQPLLPCMAERRTHSGTSSEVSAALEGSCSLADEGILKQVVPSPRYLPGMWGVRSRVAPTEPSRDAGPVGDGWRGESFGIGCSPSHTLYLVKSHVKGLPGLPLSRHLRLPGHSLEKIQVVLIQSGFRNTYEREQRESFFIHKFRTFAKGINESAGRLGCLQNPKCPDFGP